VNLSEAAVGLEIRDFGYSLMLDITAASCGSQTFQPKFVVFPVTGCLLRCINQFEGACIVNAVLSRSLIGWPHHAD
jgi:hypothetical protein